MLLWQQSGVDDDSIATLVISVAVSNNRCVVRHIAAALHLHLAVPSLVRLSLRGLSQGCLMKRVRKGLEYLTGHFVDEETDLEVRTHPSSGASLSHTGCGSAGMSCSLWCV